MEFVADFHIHSKYSRATSSEMDIPNLAKWAKIKGIKLLGTGDFTHHLWLEELKRYLTEIPKKGLYIYEDVYFILSAEISNIFSQASKTYRVHNMILVPSFKLAEEVNHMLSFYGNLASDGRPILGMSCIKLAEELFKISSEIMLIPSHIWTPWFSVFGSNSGFNSLEEAFGRYSKEITALETGLSSDPPMNWRISWLDNFSLVSNSDSHSPSRIGREANVFSCELNYYSIKEVLKNKDKNSFLYTIEFFPEEGKYHYDGHRVCKVRLHPQDTKKYNGFCPVCKKPLTRGVLHRVDELADRPEGFVKKDTIGYQSLVPLEEIIAESKGLDKRTKVVEKEYFELINRFGSELDILLKIPLEEFKGVSPKIVEGIKRVREKKIKTIAGYDGEYGIIKIFEEEEKKESNQLTFF